MRRTALILSLVSLLLRAAPAPADDVQVTARVDRAIVTLGESLQMEVIISNAKGQVHLPDLADVKVLPGGTSSSVQIVNGRMSQKQVHAFLLIPRRAGQVTIPALPVDIDGAVYHTDPIVITVNESGTGDTAEQAVGKEVWVAADVSEPAPFLGQQITYTFRLVHRVPVSDAKFEPPAFDGFSAKEIKDRQSYRKTINGRDHMITEVYFVLTPLAAGERTIDPAVLQVGIIRQDRDRKHSAFDDFFRRSAMESRILQTEPVSVTVRPLPPLAGNKTFSGLVGRFGLTASVEPRSLRVGESATMTVTIDGQGNVMDAEAPAVEIPPAFKQYADTPEERLQLEHRGFGGSKVFRTALVPVDSGSFDLPSIELTYFDVGQEAYRTVSAALPPVTVQPSDTARAAPRIIAPRSLQPLKETVAFTGRDILPPNESLAAIKPRSPLSPIRFIFFLALPAMIFLGLSLFRRLRRRDDGPAAVMAARARGALKNAQRQSGDASLSFLHQALTAAILSVAGRTGQALTWKEARALLVQCGRQETAEYAADLLAQIESLKFGGTGLDDRHRVDLLDRTQTMVKDLLQ